MQYLSFILFALAAALKGFMDTIVFREGQGVDKSILPTRWSPFVSYGTVKMLFGYFRPDAYHIAMYIFQFLIVGTIITYKQLFGYWDALIFLFIWGLFFETTWRLLYKHKN